MSCWSGKNVLIGITGSIAAYKSSFLVREFIKLGANIKIIQTPSSKEFVTPLTLSTLSKNPVITSFTKEDDPDFWNDHVQLGLWADIFIIAPTSAKTISKMASGNCDNFLLATYLSARCPVFFAPAMDLDMYKHHSTQKNINSLISFGNYLIPPKKGELASGLNGVGRMTEPNDIIKFIEKEIFSDLPLKNKKILITAGPTIEAIDPVRYISNYSTGKMGYELAEVSSSLGADVILISGPSDLVLTNKNIKKINITSSEEMLKECLKYFKHSNVLIMTAAVSDFKIKTKKNKIKKSNKSINLTLEPNIDILKILTKKKKNQFICGFALETNNSLENAQNKIVDKKMDMIVLNSLKEKGAGFGKETNKISIIDKENKVIRYKLKSKYDVAKDIINFLIKKI